MVPAMKVRRLSCRGFSIGRSSVVTVMVRLLDGLVMFTSALVVVVALILDAVALCGLVARRGVFGVGGTAHHRSIGMPPVRTNRTTSTAASNRKAMFSQVV